MSKRTRVELDSDGARLVGHVYRPAADGHGPLPGVVVAGTWTSVKEQMADRYAERLAAAGYVTLSFDFAGFGESGGEPRDRESPAAKITDLHNAIGLLASLDDVDPNRIAALGVCAGAGYVVAEAVADPRVKALALVAPWLHDADIVDELYGGPAAVGERIAAANSAAGRFERTGEVEYVPACDPGDPNAAMPFEVDFYLNPARGGIAEWPNRFAVMSWTEWVTFDPIALAPRIAIPMLTVNSEDAAVPQGTHRFLDRLAAPHEAVWTTGTQFDFYDDDPTVDGAVEAAATHLKDALGA